MYYNRRFKRAGIKKWISFTGKRLRMRALLKRATKHWTAAIEARLFDRWADAAVERKENRESLSKVSFEQGGNNGGEEKKG